MQSIIFIGILDMTAIECLYISDITALSAGKFNCEDRKNPSKCNFKHHCDARLSVSIKVRNCHEFFVYYLKPLPLTKKITLTHLDNVNNSPKEASYCGIKAGEQIIDIFFLLLFALSK